MNARFDPPQLDAELLAAGVMRIAFVGCRSGTRRDQDGSDDVAQIIDWLSSHPTAAERTMAQAILAAHDPTKRERNDDAERTRMLDVANRLDAGTATQTEIRESLAKLLRRAAGR